MAHQQALAGQYRTLAGRLDQQRRMLLNITESIAEWLTVQAADGRLTYVNTAFAKAVERPRETLLGRPLAELLPRSAAIALSDVDDGDPTEGRVREVEIAGRRRFLGTTFAAINDDAGRHLGTVALTRDETDAVRQRRRRRKALEQTIEAFVHAIERRDPFLLGHTRRLRELAIVIGRRLGLGGDELSGLVMAASLSQIGKVFIADAVLTKQGRHSAAETAAMRRHVDHAIEILTPIDFRQPVVRIIAQMHERLDGTGYPKGLRGSKISLPARILGVLDVFCARTAPRSYRNRLSVGKTLYHLATNPERYDLKVIAALAEAVGSDENETLPDEVLALLPDARAWRAVARRTTRTIAA
jgi:PAS domain S-box-containing protein